MDKYLSPVKFLYEIVKCQLVTANVYALDGWAFNEFSAGTKVQ